MTSGPGSRREESTQFSLQELLRLEDERIEEQKREQRAREAAKLQDQADAEQRKREAAAAKERTDAEAAAQQRSAELDELARREAMQKAIVEQARLTVDVRARAEERELERRHEIELSRLAGEAKTGRVLPLAGASLLGGAVMFVVMLGVQLGVTKPAQARREGELEYRITQAEARLGEESRRVEEQRRTIDQLEQKLKAAVDEAKATPKAKPPSSVTTPTTHPPRPQTPSTPAQPQEKCANKWDPLCAVP
jgi:colicin import membrane protein